MENSRKTIARLQKTLRDIIAQTERICDEDDDISDMTLDGINRIKRMNSTISHGKKKSKRTINGEK